MCTCHFAEPSLGNWMLHDASKMSGAARISKPQFGEPWLKGSATFDVSIVNKLVYHISKFIIYIGQMKDVLCYMFYVVCKHNKIIYSDL